MHLLLCGSCRFIESGTRGPKIRLFFSGKQAMAFGGAREAQRAHAVLYFDGALCIMAP